MPAILLKYILFLRHSIFMLIGYECDGLINNTGVKERTMKEEKEFKNEEAANQAIRN